mmetsp:Transcript_11795/g.38810  ORF Transcript_11795/g.38810 Transcript_11795/m.38810 type:complete len:164 (+) Transcript_11795:33-524(+)
MRSVEEGPLLEGRRRMALCVEELLMDVEGGWFDLVNMTTARALFVCASEKVPDLAIRPRKTRIFEVAALTMAFPRLDPPRRRVYLDDGVDVVTVFRMYDSGWVLDATVHVTRKDVDQGVVYSGHGQCVVREKRDILGPGPTRRRRFLFFPRGGAAASRRCRAQ